MNIRVIVIEATIIDVTHPSVVLEVIDDMGNRHRIAFVPALLDDIKAAMSNVYFGGMNEYYDLKKLEK